VRQFPECGGVGIITSFGAVISAFYRADADRLRAVAPGAAPDELVNTNSFGCRTPPAFRVMVAPVLPPIRIAPMQE
jgi:hypothetical protein